MDDLLLVAASGLAREALVVIRAVGRHRVIGVLDDDEALHGSELDGVPVLGGLDRVAAHPGAHLLLCPGGGQQRRRLAERLAHHGAPFATVVAPSADLAPDTRVGPGTIVLGGVVATAAVTIGAHAVVMPNAVLTHDTVLGDFATVCAGVTLGGRVQVGRSAYLGMSSSVRQDVHVGEGATLGMGSVLLHDLPDHQTWVGVPARPVPVTATKGAS